MLICKDVLKAKVIFLPKPYLWDRNRNGLGSKLTWAIRLCPWERHITALSSVLWSWKAV